MKVKTKTKVFLSYLVAMEYYIGKFMDELKVA